MSDPKRDGLMEIVRLTEEFGGYAAELDACSWCHATGFVGTNICQECRGTGREKRSE